MANFIVQFPLKTEKYQEDILDKRFEIGRKIYNSLVTVIQKRYKEMIKTKQYRSIKEELKDIHSSASKKNTKRKKELCTLLNEIHKQHNINEYSFHTDIKNMQKHFKDNVDSFTAQKIATTLWKAYDKLFFGNGNKIHYKKYNSLNSLEGKSNKTGIRFKDDYLLWNGLKIPVLIDYDNYYEYQTMQCDISYCRVLRKFIHNKNHYYIQIVFKGNPPIKVNKETGEIKHPIVCGDVGIDIGTSTIAISSESDVKILELADKVQNIENQKRLFLRKMDRSKRATNPDNFNEDGTIKKKGNKKIIWNKSNHYIKHQNQLKELYRKQADVRKYQHECLANYIVSLGNNVFVEHMNFSGLQRRSTKTEISEKTGRYKKKKRFGKSLANRAPAMLMTIVNRKLKYFDTMLFEVNTYKAKASQFNHFDGTYKKKSLSQRWNDFDGLKIQRDMYSAFLIMNINNDLQGINQQKCNDRFENFKRLHDIEVNRLKGSKNLSSIAI